MRRIWVICVLVAAILAAFATPASAQTDGSNDSLLVRVNGNEFVPPGESHGVVVVVNGNLNFEGDANTIVLVEGIANLAAAEVETLVVVSATVTLGPETVVTGDIFAVDSVIERDPTATVQGTIQEGVGWEIARGFWVFGLLLMIGWALLVILAGVIMAGVAPVFSRRAARTITSDLGATIGAGLLLWILLPIVGVLLFATIIGIPAALAIWFGLLPVLSFVGLLVAGVRVGEALVERNGGEGHPYLAAFVGLILLVIAGAIPVVGPLITTIAGFFGSGAIALTAIRVMRDRSVGVVGQHERQT